MVTNGQEFNCFILIQEKSSLLMKSLNNNKNRVIKSKDMIALRRHCLIIRSSKQNRCLESGDWVLYLTSKHKTYELTFNSKPKKSFELDLSFCPFYLIDCQKDQHWLQWLQCQYLCCESVNYSTAENLKNRSMNDSIMTIGFNHSEVLIKMREFCETYFDSKSVKKQSEVCKQFNRYLIQIVPQLCEKLNSEVLDKEPNVVVISGQTYVFGDLHGNVKDLYDYEKAFWGTNGKHQKANILFLGDYVDRGLFGVEVSVYLLALKMSDPNKFTLIRGNHEVREVNKSYTFYNECLQKFGKKDGKMVWDHINRSFERLPLASVIDNTVFCCHGGVPKGLNLIAELSQIPKPLVDPATEAPIAHQMLWNDPIESMTTYTKDTEKHLSKKGIMFVSNRVRGTGYYFTAQAVKQFLDSNGLDFIIRAHEAVPEGYKYTSDDKCITVFSSSNYGGADNSTACAEVTDDHILVVTLKRGSQTADIKPNN